MIHLTPTMVGKQRTWVHRRSSVIVPLINQVRSELETMFSTSVVSVSEMQYSNAVDEVFEDGDLAVNVAALIVLLREIDVDGDYPGFIVDEILGRELAGIIAGNQPLRLLGEATFHFADVMHHDPGEPAGIDDLDAALAAGFQTRLPGWNWTTTPSPFSVDSTDP